MLGKDDQSRVLRSDVEHEAGVVPEVLDVALVAGIEKDRSGLWVEIVLCSNINLYTTRY